MYSCDSLITTALSMAI